MLKTILAAADGSDHADRAIDWAVELAATHGARLVLLYVAPHRDVPPALRRMAEVEHIVDPGRAAAPRVADPVLPSGRTAASNLEETMVSSARIYREIGERVLSAARRRAEARGVEAVETSVEHGDPAHQILEAAGRHAVDLIVMGPAGSAISTAIGSPV